MQLFEWCNYLLYSKSQDASPAVITCGAGTAGILEPSYFECLQAYYRGSVHGYSMILNEYESTLIKAKNARSRSLFPDKSVWNPPGRTLNASERRLLLGPSNNIVYYKKLALCDQTTKRLIFFDAKSSVSRSSFVSLLESTTPKFGCILSLFSQTFVETTFWVLLEVYSEVCFDSNCKMWYVPANSPIDKTVVPLRSGASIPLVVARDTEENQRLWFLNYNY